MADNYELWKNLGIDLETHDLLCAALPQAFGDVFLSMENRPEGMAFWDAVAADIHGIRAHEMVQAQAEGRKVFGTFCVYVPDEIIVACNGIYSGLCGGSQFWVPDGEKYLPANICPLIKASVGARMGRTCPYFRIADVFVGETTCDGKKKAYEILAKDVDMYVMDVPQMKRPKDYLAWESEIADFAKMVEEKTGVELTVENLNAAIKLINERRKAIGRVYEACTDANVIPISGADRLLMVQISFFDDPARCAQMCNNLADELEQRVADGVSVFPAGTKRIMITGTPLAVPNWKLHHIVETCGGAVVCEEMCTGTRYFENLVDETQTTLEGQFKALSDRYMMNNCACFTPNTAHQDDIIRLAKKYHVDGIINANLQFCQIYDVEAAETERVIEEAGFPVLHIETDYTDNDAEQLRTRIGAFIEMLG
ncbi:MAG: 2-hydroxyacyl-CoA dehydratase [Eggerthellaceae bacterium]|nr:2-hydroxyacyl-CoA dehydratase [Eggerthellaceae bacterium]